MEKVQLSTIYKTRGVLQKLNKTTSKIAKANYWIGRLTEKLKKEIDFIEEQRVTLIKKYGTEQEDKSFTVAPENMESFLKEFEELLNTELDFECQKIEIDYLDGRDLTPEDMNSLNFVLKVE